MGWLWVASLALVAVGVLAARSTGRFESAQPALPTPVAAAPMLATPTVIPTPAATPVEPTAAPATPKPTARATVAPTTAAAKPTAAPTHAATPNPTPKPTAPPTTFPGTTPTRVAAVTAAGGEPGQGAAAAATAAAAAAAPTSTSTSTRTSAAASAANAGVVMLTFDAGADRGYAEDILDTLAEEHVVASFGITGNWAKANPDLVRRMAADGHLVLNHTLDHRSFTGVSDSQGGLSSAARRAELDNADAIIAPLIGHSTRPFYRLPYGDDDAHVAADVGSDGYTRKVGWTVDSQGWRGLQSSDILARCLKLAAPGALYVFHVGRESQDGIVLAQVIHGLREKGFAFKRVE